MVNMTDQYPTQQQELTAAVLTLAHAVRRGPARHEGDRQYAHDEIVEEYEAWLGYVVGSGEPVSPHDYGEDNA